MTNTDRAFINAFQPAVVSPPSSVDGPSIPGSGPHYAPPAALGERAPLSEHLARLRQADGAPKQAATSQPAPLRPMLELDTLAWPAIVERLAAEQRAPLLDVLARVTASCSAEDTPVLALAGVRSGVGTTTCVLALARLVGRLGGVSAIVDTHGGPAGAAHALGVHLAASEGDAAELGVMIASPACGASLLTCLPSEDPATLAKATARLTMNHDLVLIDTSDASLSRGVAPTNAELLLGDAPNPVSGERAAVTERFAAAGMTVTGVIEIGSANG